MTKTTASVLEHFDFGLGAVISSLRRVRGERGLFTSDDINSPSRSAPMHLLWYSAIQYSYPLYTLRKVQRFSLCHRPRSSYTTCVGNCI